MPSRSRHRLIAALVVLGAAVSSAPTAAARTSHPRPAAGSTDAEPIENGRIAFVLDPGTGQQIMTVRPDGTQLRTLVRYRHAAAESPAWSRRGDRLTYSRVNPSSCHIILARRDGTHRRDLTGDHTGCESSPTFTPTGSRIVFVMQSCDSCTTWIASMDLAGRHRHRILAAAPGTSPEDVVVSPDGRSIAFESTADSDFHRALLVVRRDGTCLRTLVPYRFDVGTHFDWSSTGRWLVYTRWSQNPDGHRSNVVLIRPDGSHQRWLTHVPTGRAAGGATFSPGGQRVVYRYTDVDRQRFWLSTMHVDGTHNTRIRELATSPQGTAWAPTLR